MNSFRNINKTIINIIKIIVYYYLIRVQNTNIHICYVPDKFIVELKSLKLYIVKFRNIGIFHEHVTNKILDDFTKACDPKKIEVVGDFKPRGGIKTTVTTKK